METAIIEAHCGLSTRDLPILKPIVFRIKRVARHAPWKIKPESLGGDAQFGKMMHDLPHLRIKNRRAVEKMKRPCGNAAILPAREEHLPALAELAGVIWRQHYPGIISHAQIGYMLGKMYSLDTLRDEIRSNGILFYRLVAAGHFVGFASLGPTDKPGVLKLHKCYLLPELHGCGLGSALLQHCEAEARRLGARRLILAVNKRNPKAIAAYQHNGFAVIESVVTDFGGGFVMDDFIMAKDLAPASS